MGTKTLGSLLMRIHTLQGYVHRYGKGRYLTPIEVDLFGEQRLQRAHHRWNRINEIVQMHGNVISGCQNEETRGGELSNETLGCEELMGNGGIIISSSRIRPRREIASRSWIADDDTTRRND
jgi:hypothetical protein